MPITFKKPDLNAPRFRKKRKVILTKKFCQDFIAQNPKYKDTPLDHIREIVRAISEKTWSTAIEKRDGVELPEQLGYIFIGSCPKKKNNNPDYKLSSLHGKMIQQRNWESDQYVAKIFYSNHEVKYRFKNHQMWGFEAVRDFKRSVSKTYPTNWKMYHTIDGTLRISHMFRKEKQKEFIDTLKEQSMLKYDEFKF